METTGRRTHLGHAYLRLVHFDNLGLCESFLRFRRPLEQYGVVVICIFGFMFSTSPDVEILTRAAATEAGPTRELGGLLCYNMRS